MNLRQFFTTQTWWGKLIGAFFGFLMAGPTGAMIGILIGNFFDRGLAEHFTRPHWVFSSEKREAIQTIVFEATFSVMGHIAKADGQVSTEEILHAKRLMDELKLNRAQTKAAQAFFNKGKLATFNLNEPLLLLRSITRQNPALIKWFLDIQYRTAQIDGLSANKLHVLNTILAKLGFATLSNQHRFYEDFIRQAGQGRTNYQYNQYNQTTASNTTVDQAYAILGVSPSASKQDVTRAYRRLMSKHHPDKLIAKGANEDTIKEANTKTQHIRKAYEQILAIKKAG